MSIIHSPSLNTVPDPGLGSCDPVRVVTGSYENTWLNKPQTRHVYYTGGPFKVTYMILPL